MSQHPAPSAISQADFLTGDCPIEVLVRRGSHARFTDEYNCKLFRLFPWPDRVQTKRTTTELGATWVVLEPQKTIARHDHDEEESFIVVSGHAELLLGSQSTHLNAGDVVYVPRLASHSLVNHSKSEAFVFIDVYWDFGGQSA